MQMRFEHAMKLSEEMEREMELREDVERGRRYKIAAEVFAEFLSNRKDEIIRDFEAYGLNVIDKDGAITEIRVMRRFRDVCAKMISLGEIAESELDRDGK